LICRQLEARKHWFNEQSEITKIIIIYRFVSLMITSIFYFINQPDYSLEKRMTVIICIAGSAVLLNYLYIKNKGHSSNILLLILIETCGNSILLIPSGGINSPYVWYSLNTILIASVELPRKYCWLNLTVYLAASLSLSAFIPVNGLGRIAQLTNPERSLILSLILITSVIQLLSKYAINAQNTSSKLTDANKELQYANKKIIESFNHIMELYQAVSLFSNQRSRNDLILLILQYTQRINKAETVFFYDATKGGNIISIQSDNWVSSLRNVLQEKLSGIWNIIADLKIPIKVSALDRSFSLISIKSSYMNYGILGVETPAYIQNATDNQNGELLRFLAEISSIALERFELEQVNDRLIIAEEQNRIANEIHDNVLQRLFSISCGIYNLTRGKEKSSMALINKEMDIIRDSINSSMNELRTAIYRLSWKKEGVDNFIVDILNYINQIKHLNHMEIDFSTMGDSELLLSAQKKAIYRIICEGIGNAVRHGKAGDVKVKLNIGIEAATLEIIDNGRGFDLDRIEADRQQGLGIKNIRFLVNSLKGSVNIHSVIGEGTNIRITIPCADMSFRGEKIV